MLLVNMPLCRSMPSWVDTYETVGKSKTVRSDEGYFLRDVTCGQLFAIVSIDPLASVYQLHDLIEETFRLVETHLPAVDTRQARARFHERRKHS